MPKLITVIAEISRVGHKGSDRYYNADICAECPKCGCIDAFLSTGEHALHGRKEEVSCVKCGHKFNIRW